MLLSSLLESAKPHASVLLSSCTLSHSLYSLFQGRPAALLPISERDRCVVKRAKETRRANERDRCVWLGYEVRRAKERRGGVWLDIFGGEDEDQV